MERGWERAFPFMNLSAAELERLIGAAVPGARVIAAHQLSSGLRNTNYRVDLAGGRTVLLRVYVADPEACEREAAVLAAVAGAVPAPGVLSWDAQANPPFAVHEWLSGSLLDQVLRTEPGAVATDVAADCGAALARIHEIRFPRIGFLGPEMQVVKPMSAWSSAVLETLDGQVEERLGSELSASVRKTVDSNAAVVDHVWAEAVLVHADYKPWNLLVARSADSDDPSSDDAPAGPLTAPSGGWRLTGILDWEFACAGCKLIDFATFLRDEASLPRGFGEAFVGAYLAAGGTLPADWRRLTGLVDLLNLVQMLSWSRDRASADLRRLVAATVSTA
jgi:Ser/Thr protein kinase RdoA (MazF antagonist)